jgi:hypothetical protein
VYVIVQDPQDGPPPTRTTHEPGSAEEAGASGEAAQPDARRPGGSGPPPHAPAHGRRHTYHYYPLAQVYFAPDRGRYYWLGPRGWRTGTRLPKSIVIEGEIAVTLELDTDVPHVRHAEVVRKIGKGKSKGKTGK